ncbi:hypothetical protein ABH994_001686 [Bradyrhizobium yuanmingense]|uniref:hypothetical protein n=1 Tax=Bradyrhizobium yuanmingense TaxID=108015 RepID=UPI00055A2C7D|nr:hypothetical protein [Bradyrhizobium yuanmingense]
MRIAVTCLIALSVAACERKPKDPAEAEFEKKFQKEAVIVMTCPGDARWASGPTAGTQRVYRYEKELWVEVVNGIGYQRVEATPETVCNVLVPPTPPDKPTTLEKIIPKLIPPKQ